MPYRPARRGPIRRVRPAGSRPAPGRALRSRGSTRHHAETRSTRHARRSGRLPAAAGPSPPFPHRSRHARLASARGSAVRPPRAQAPARRPAPAGSPRSDREPDGATRPAPRGSPRTSTAAAPPGTPGDHAVSRMVGSLPAPCRDRLRTADPTISATRPTTRRRSAGRSLDEAPETAATHRWPAP